MSCPQSQVKASTASVPGHQYLELNRGNFVLWWSANLSIVCGPLLYYLFLLLLLTKIQATGSMLT